MAKKCEDTCEALEKYMPPGVVYEWKMIKLRWEKDFSQPDPYQVVEKGKPTILPYRPPLSLNRSQLSVLVASNFSSVKWKLSEVEGLDHESRSAPPHKLSPFSFVRMGLELEDHQYVLCHLL